MFATQSKIAFKMIRTMSSQARVAGQPQIHMTDLHINLNKNQRMVGLDRKIDLPETKQPKTTMKAAPKTNEFQGFAYLC